MKFFWPLLLVLTAVTFNSLAQSGNNDKFSVGLEGGFPVGSTSNYYNFVVGASLKYEYPVAENLFVTVSAGFNRLQGKTREFSSNFSIKTAALNVIPVKAGIKNYFSETFYVEGQFGAAFSVDKGVGTAFVYSPGIGYSAISGFEIGVRYEAWAQNRTNGMMILRLASRF